MAYQAYDPNKPLPEFDVARKRAQQQVASQKQEESDALARRYASMGNLQSGSYIKQQQLAEDRAAQRAQAADESITSQEMAMRRSLEEAERGRSFSAEQAGLQRAWGSGEREAGQRFAGEQAGLQRTWGSGEREAGQKFAGEQAGLQRSWQSGEREAGQTFTAAEAGKLRGWQSGESALQRGWATGEREAGQLYATSERLGTQEYGTSERVAGQEYGTSERLETEKFQAGESALERHQKMGLLQTELQAKSVESERDRTLQKDMQAKELKQQASEFTKSLGLQKWIAEKGFEMDDKALGVNIANAIAEAEDPAFVMRYLDYIEGNGPKPEFIPSESPSYFCTEMFKRDYITRGQYARMNAIMRAARKVTPVSLATYVRLAPIAVAAANKNDFDWRRFKSDLVDQTLEIRKQQGIQKAIEHYTLVAKQIWDSAVAAPTLQLATVGGQVT